MDNIHQNVLENYFQLIRSVEICIENNLIRPALIQIYSGIDSIGWLVSDNDFDTRDSFLAWVENYLLPQKAFQCTALDLYAARCGVLHTQTPESYLYKKGQAKKIAYAWGSASADELQETIKLEKRLDLVAVHVDDLHWAFRYGLADTINEVKENQILVNKFNKKARMGFSNLPIEEVQNYLDFFCNNS